MSHINKLNNFVKFLLKNYNIKIVDFDYIDQVIIHDAEYHYGWSITHMELQYIKATLTMYLYKKEIEKNYEQTNYDIF